MISARQNTDMRNEKLYISTQNTDSERKDTGILADKNFV